MERKEKQKFGTCFEIKNWSSNKVIKLEIKIKIKMKTEWKSVPGTAEFRSLIVTWNSTATSDTNNLIEGFGSSKLIYWLLLYIL